MHKQDKFICKAILYGLAVYFIMSYLWIGVLFVMLYFKTR